VTDDGEWVEGDEEGRSTFKAHRQEERWGTSTGSATRSEEWGVRHSVLAAVAGRQRFGAGGNEWHTLACDVGSTIAQNSGTGSLTGGASSTVPRFKPIQTKSKQF
jgi:hypothetical protein